MLEFATWSLIKNKYVTLVLYVSFKGYAARASLPSALLLFLIYCEERKKKDWQPKTTWRTVAQGSHTSRGAVYDRGAMRYRGVV